MPSSIILPAIFGSAAAGIYALGTIGYAALGFAINMIASSIISKALGSDSPTTNDAQKNPNPGSRTQVPPAGDNKLPVVYGSAYVGGIITDLSITSNNQTLYYVLTLAECTNTEQGGAPDTYTFGDVYWGGKKVIFNSTDQYKVDSLLDESTGIYDTSVAGKLEFYKYKNGSNSPVNSTKTAIQVMQATDLVYKWDSNKLMSNCAFVIIKVIYSQRANLTGLQQTKFQITNSRTKPGDCFFDYLTSARYGAAISESNIDTDSLDALNIYCDGLFEYGTNGGGYGVQTRFKFDGTLETNQAIMQNLQLMSASCDCLIKYNEITGKWGVIVQTPIVVPVMDINDSNMVSAIAISPIDIASSYNIAEVKFPDGTAQDSFNSAIFDLAVIDPTLLYPNEPVNKQTISLPLVSNNVRAQYLATRFLKAAREDLQVQVDINYSGLQLEAGDIVTVTNSNYGWTAKQFRINKVVEKFSDDGSITASLSLMEFNASVYDDTEITEFTPSPNTGIGDPLFFGTLYAPVVTSLQPSITNPSFGLNVTSASSGIVQYAEIWYSAFATPTDEQRIFAGTTDVNPGGNPFAPDASMGTVNLSSIPSGDWYFAVRMVNALGSSIFSPSSSVLRWRPTTFQYGERYLTIAYADDLSGTNISSSPRNKDYYGLKNASTYGYDSNPANYTWYLAQPTFGTSVYLLYTNRTGRKFSFASGFAGFAAGTAQFVPTATGTYDPSIWQALEDGVNFIDLDVRTGQIIETGTTNIGAGEIAITNNADGKVVASLAQLLDFGAGVQTLTGSASTVTIDIYGRVLGFSTPDGFYYTRYATVATSGQTVFTPTARQANYIVGMDLVFRNGLLLDTSEYTETSTDVTLGTGAVVGDQIVILSMRAISQGIAYVSQYINVATIVGAVVTYNTALPYQTIVAGDIHTFTTSGTPTQYTVSAWNPATQEITYTTSVTGVTAGATIYQYRSSGLSYRPFSRFTATLTNASSYTPTTWAIHSGYEKVFLNGASVNDQDYDISGGSINTFPATATGLLTFIQFNDNNQTIPIGNQTSDAINTVVGTITYNYNLNADAFELYNNGALQVLTDDYTLGATSYTLTTSPTSNLNILQQTTYSRTGAA
jgi:hypothetical protein